MSYRKEFDILKTPNGIKIAYVLSYSFSQTNSVCVLYLENDYRITPFFENRDNSKIENWYIENRADNRDIIDIITIMDAKITEFIEVGNFVKVKFKLDSKPENDYIKSSGNGKWIEL